MAALIGAALAASGNENGGDASPTSIGYGNDDAKSEGSTNGSDTDVSLDFSVRQNNLFKELEAKKLLESITKENTMIANYQEIDAGLRAKLDSYPLSNMFVNTDMVIKRFNELYQLSEVELLTHSAEQSDPDECHLINVFRNMMNGFSHDNLRVDKSKIAGKGIFANHPIGNGQLLGFFKVDRRMAERFRGNPEGFWNECDLSDSQRLMIETHEFPVGGLQYYGITDDGSQQRSTVGVQMCNDGNFSHFIHGLAQISAWLDVQRSVGNEIEDQEIERAIGILWVYRWCNGILKAQDRLNNKYGFYALMNCGEEIDAGEEICYPYIQLSEAALVEDIMNFMCGGIYKNRTWEISIEDPLKSHYERVLEFTTLQGQFSISMKTALQNYINDTNYGVGDFEVSWNLPKCLSDNHNERFTLGQTDLQKALHDAIKVFGERGHSSRLSIFVGTKRRASRRSRSSSMRSKRSNRASASMKSRMKTIQEQLLRRSQSQRLG